MDMVYLGLVGALWLSLLGLSYGCDYLKHRGGL